MLDVIAAHDDELPLPVEVEGVDDAEPRLPTSRATRGAQSPAEDETNEDKNRNEQNDDHDGNERRANQLVVRKHVAKGLHPA